MLFNDIFEMDNENILLVDSYDIIVNRLLNKINNLKVITTDNIK